MEHLMPTLGLNLAQQIMKLSIYDISIAYQCNPSLATNFASTMRRKWEQVNKERYSSIPCADCLSEREEVANHMLLKCNALAPSSETG